MFAKLCYFYAYFYLSVFTYKYSILFYISGGIFTFSGYQFQLSALSFRCSCVFIKTDVKIGFFPIPIAYWSGFGIFEQNRENPGEIGMVGHPELLIEIQMAKNHTQGEGYTSVFLFNVQVFFICNYYSLYVILRLKFERIKLAFL